MKLQALKCPNCDAKLEIENGLDILYCKYCGYKIILADQSDVVINAKVKMKNMEHAERLKDKKYAHERYKMEFKKKDERHSILLYIGIMGGIILLCLCISFFGNIGADKQNKELNAIVDEIMIDIENEDFAAAYIKANSLYWDDSWTLEGEDKWDATRKAVLKQIEEAEKNYEK